MVFCGLLGNAFPFSILNAHFVFGSIFSMLALMFLGWGRGVLAAAIVSGYTFFAWNHPWALLTMTAEAAVVGWLTTRRRIHFVTADGIYWLVLGIPLGWFCFHIISELSLTSTFFLITKQSINGIANALIARLIYTVVSQKIKAERITLRETLANVILIFTLTSALILLVHDSRMDLAETDRNVRSILLQNSRNATFNLETWIDERRKAVVYLAELAAELPLEKMQERLEQADALDEDFLRMALLDGSGVAIAYSPPFDDLGHPNIGKSFADRPYMPLLKESLRPLLSEVMPSRFGGRPAPVAIMLAPVLIDGAYNGAVAGILNLEKIQRILDTNVDGQNISYTLIDRNSNVVLSNRKDQQIMKPFSMGEGSFGQLAGLHGKSMPPLRLAVTSSGGGDSESDKTIRHWIPSLPPYTSTIDLWGRSRYVIEETIDQPLEWKLILEQPVAPFQKRLYREYSEKFFVLFGIVFVALVLSELISRRAVTPVERLSLLTRYLPARIASGKTVDWPESTVLEIDQLIVNVREMADSLKDTFAEIRKINETLERRVEESTQELKEANLKLQASQYATLKLLDDLKAENEARKQKEAELQRVMMAIEQAGEAIFITGVDGTIQYVNPAFESVTGYTREEALGKNPRILKSGRQTSDFYQDLWKTISGGRTWKGRMVNKRKDGKFYIEEATISPVFDDEGRISNYVAVKRDITEHVELSEQFQQAQKLESVGRLAGGVAHDFNNMLSIILGYTDLALYQVSEGSPLHAHLMEIRQAANRSADLTRQLLAFARKQTIHPRVLDLNSTVEGMLKMLRRLIGEDIHLTWLPGKDLWPVKMDPAQIDQVLANLCVNARDAIAGVGNVTIETKNVSIDADYCSRHPDSFPGRFVLLAVSDDGCSMDRETMGRVFEPFFTTKGVGKGTGLGLSTVYGIVKQNNGFVNVYSEPGKGTTFKLYLPCATAETDIPVPESDDYLVSGHGETVLLVEDEQAIREMGELMLKRLGYRVMTAGTPSEALKLVEKEAGGIQMLITDVVMPEMNGRELAERLQTVYPGLKTLFISGYTANAIAHHGVLDEGIRFLPKPFSLKDLANKLAALIGKPKEAD